MVKSCGKSTKCHFSAFLSYYYEIGATAGHYFIPVGGAPFMNTVTTNIILTKSGYKQLDRTYHLTLNQL